jgi:hypothetical protein
MKNSEIRKKIIQWKTDRSSDFLGIWLWIIFFLPPYRGVAGVRDTGVLTGGGVTLTGLDNPTGPTVTKRVCCADTPSASVALTVMVAVPHLPGAKVRVSAAFERPVRTSAEFVLPSIDSFRPFAG